MEKFLMRKYENMVVHCHLGIIKLPVDLGTDINLHFINDNVASLQVAARNHLLEAIKLPNPG